MASERTLACAQSDGSLPAPIDGVNGFTTAQMGVSINGVPKMDGLYRKIPLKWMIWGYPHVWTPPKNILPELKFLGIKLG